MGLLVVGIEDSLVIQMLVLAKLRGVLLKTYIYHQSLNVIEVFRSPVTDDAQRQAPQFSCSSKILHFFANECLLLVDLLAPEEILLFRIRHRVFLASSLTRMCSSIS